MVELADASNIYINAPTSFDESCSKYSTPKHIDALKQVINIIEEMNVLIEEELCSRVKELARSLDMKLVDIAQAIRGALSGKLVSPSVFEVMSIIGKTESTLRIKRYISYYDD